MAPNMPFRQSMLSSQLDGPIERFVRMMDTGTVYPLIKRQGIHLARPSRCFLVLPLKAGVMLIGSVPPLTADPIRGHVCSCFDSIEEQRRI